jgi:hypothetical protein
LDISRSGSKSDPVALGLAIKPDIESDLGLAGQPYPIVVGLATQLNLAAFGTEHRATRPSSFWHRTHKKQRPQQHF